MAGRPSIRQAQKDQTRQRIQEAASKLFCDKGYFATTMQHIATATDLQRSTIYLHFGDKEEILESIAETHVADMAGVVGTIPGPVPEREDIEHWVRQVARAVAAQSTPTILFCSLATMPEVPEAADIVGKGLLSALAQKVTALAPINDKAASRKSRLEATEKARAILWQLFAVCIRYSRRSTSKAEMDAAYGVTADMIVSLVGRP